MAHEITFVSDRDRDAVIGILRTVFDAGPFVESAPVDLGGHRWSVSLAPKRTDMTVGFASVAEFQLRLCRSVEILSVLRHDLGALAAAS